MDILHRALCELSKIPVRIDRLLKIRRKNKSKLNEENLTKILTTKNLTKNLTKKNLTKILTKKISALNLALQRGKQQI